MTPFSPHRVVVIDDQLLTRAGIAALLADMPGFDLVGEAHDLPSALAVVASTDADIVLLDLHLPGLGDGLEVLRQLRAAAPAAAVLVLSSSTDPDNAAQALSLGATGYVCKDFVIDELAFALRHTAAGRRYLSASVPLGQRVPPAVELSSRQTDVLAGIARGLTNKSLARELGISIKTVAYHRAELIRRLDLHDVASLTRHAVALGLVTR